MVHFLQSSLLVDDDDDYDDVHQSHGRIALITVRFVLLSVDLLSPFRQLTPCNPFFQTLSLTLQRAIIELIVSLAAVENSRAVFSI